MRAVGSAAGLEVKTEDRQVVVKQDRLHERSSAKRGEEGGGRESGGGLGAVTDVGAAVEDGRPRRQHDILLLLTSKSRGLEVS